MLKRMLLVGLLLAVPSTVLAVDAEVRLYLVSDFRYERAGSTKADPVMGQSLCGTRCNALTTDYLNVVEPGGWRLIKVAGNRELSVPLNNPFMGGRCICIVDEYMVRVDYLNKPR